MTNTYISMPHSTSNASLPVLLDAFFRFVIDIDLSGIVNGDEHIVVKLLQYGFAFIISWTPSVCGIAYAVLTFKSQQSEDLEPNSAQYKKHLLIIAIVAEVVRRVSASMGAAIGRERDRKIDEERRKQDEERFRQYEERRKQDHLQIVGLLNTLQQNGIDVNDRQLQIVTTGVETQIAKSIHEHLRSQILSVVDASFDESIQKYDTQLRYDAYNQLTPSERNIAIPRSGSE